MPLAIRPTRASGACHSPVWRGLANVSTLATTASGPARVRLESGDGADSDDVAVTAGDQLGQQRPRRAHDAQHVGVVHPPPLLLVGIHDRVEPEGAAGVVDQQVALGDLAGERLDGCGVRDIEGERSGPDGFGDRLHFHAGDFLKEPLPSADVLVLGRVLHNWNLVTKKILLRKAYDALPTGGAVIILERLIDDERKLNVGGLLASLHMLIMTEGGFDFSAAECLSWMHDAGFRDRRVNGLPGRKSSSLERPDHRS